MVKGSPKFDGIAVLEFTVNFLGPTVSIDAKCAFTNTKTGDTHGWTHQKQWSPTTIEKLKELRAAMELDLGNTHLEGGGEILVGPAGSTATTRSFTPEGGLGEHLGTERIPSV